MSLPKGDFMPRKAKPYRLIEGDCLERMREVQASSIDLIIADLPYGITKCHWDQRIDLDRFWAEVRRVLKADGCAVMFADMKLAVELINANRSWFRYDLVWEKTKAVGFLNANRQPLRAHELVLIFSKSPSIYRPQMKEGSPYRIASKKQSNIYGSFKGIAISNVRLRFPKSVFRFSNNFERGNGGRFLKGPGHPTSKPIELLTWLIQTFSDSGMSVLDPSMGSGSTGIACLRTGRKFVGIELDAGFFEIASTRLANEHKGTYAKTQAQ